MIRLKRLNIKNFRSFKGDHVIEFDSNGLYIVEGNKSGSGKSSIFLAISYALGDSAFSYKDLCNWETSDEMEVGLVLESNDAEYIINRGKKLSFSRNGIPEEGANKEIEGKIKEALGYDIGVVSLLSYREQKSRGMFLSMTDSEKKEFLVKLLSLGNFEEEIDLSHKKIKELTAVLNSKQVFPSTLQYNEEEKEKVIFSLIHNIAEIECQIISISVKNEFDNKKAQEVSILLERRILDRSSKYIKSLKLLDIEIDKMQGILSKIKLEEQQRSLAYNLEQKEIVEKRNKLLRIINEEPLLQKELKKQEYNLSQLEMSVCPTCRQSWISSTGIDECKLEIYKTKNKLDNIEKNKPELSSLVVGTFAQNPMLEKANEILLRKTVERTPLIKAISDLEIKSSLYKKKYLLKVHKSQSKRNEEAKRLQQQAYSLKLQLQSANQEKQIAIAQKKEREKIELELARLNSEINSEKDYSDLIKGFIDNIFDEILDEVSDQANKIIGKISNVSHIAINFKSNYQTQKGATKQSITPEVQFNGVVKPIKAGCSGGMYSSIELAVDLALSNVITRRAGKGIGWLILDEANEGLDLISKETCLEILKEYSKDQLIMVVDHGCDFKEMFDKEIKILYNNGCSSIL